jgi:hypothetical protein
VELNTVRIDVPSSPQAFALKDQLTADGLLYGIDYRWKYCPNESDYWETYEKTSAWVEFTFTDEKLATYYRIKWQ